MARRALALGLVLTGLGVGVYFGGSGSSVTALIPAFLGLPIAIFALLSMRRDRSGGCLVAAAVLAFVGFIGTVPGLLKVGQLLQGADLARPIAVAVQSVVAVLCAIYLAFAASDYAKRRDADRRDPGNLDQGRDVPTEAA